MRHGTDVICFVIRVPYNGCTASDGAQIAEINALQSVFSEDGAVKLSPVEHSALERVHQVCHMLVSVDKELDQMSGMWIA